MKLKPGFLYKIKNDDQIHMYRHSLNSTEDLKTRVELTPGTFVLFLDEAGGAVGWSENRYLYGDKILRDSYRTFCFPEKYFTLVSTDEEEKQGE